MTIEEKAEEAEMVKSKLLKRTALLNLESQMVFENKLKFLRKYQNLKKVEK